MIVDNLLADLNSILLYRKDLLKKKSILLAEYNRTASTQIKNRLILVNRDIAEATSAIGVINGLLESA